MATHEYLSEDGAGGFARCVVRDLVPLGGQAADLLLVFESPHTEELRTGVPVSGRAGQAALNALSIAISPPQSLGLSIASRHVGGDARVGIMNASQVPLQLAAYQLHAAMPAVSNLDWDLLSRMRKSSEDDIDAMLDPRVRAASRLLLPSLQQRLSRIEFAPNATVVTAGKFAQRSWNSLSSRPSATNLAVPHPSNGWWKRSTASPQHRANLEKLKRLFAIHTS